MICDSCQSIDNEHYTYRGKNGVRIPFAKCKKCHNPAREKKATGFDKLAQDVQDKIREALADRKNKVSDIAREQKINYENLRRWIAKGTIWD